MNTLEKRKLEGIITASLQDARTAYQQRRQREHDALVQKFDNDIPASVQKFVKKAKDAKVEYLRKEKEIAARKEALDKERKAHSSAHSVEVEAINSEARKLGFSVSFDYENEVHTSLYSNVTYTGRYGNTAVRTYSEPTLTAHSKETHDHVQKLDDMANEYAIAVWADNGDMGNVLERFTNDLRAIV